MRKLSFLPLTAAFILVTSAVTAQEAVSADGVPISKIYLNSDGAGILRYEDPEGGGQEYIATFGGLSDNTFRPYEVIGQLGGPWTGPRIAICMDSYREDQTMGGRLAFELYSITESKPVMRYQLVFNSDKAEEIITVGEGAGPGECSRKYAM